MFPSTSTAVICFGHVTKFKLYSLLFTSLITLQTKWSIHMGGNRKSENGSVTTTTKKKKICRFLASVTHWSWEKKNCYKKKQNKDNAKSCIKINRSSSKHKRWPLGERLSQVWPFPKWKGRSGWMHPEREAARTKQWRRESVQTLAQPGQTHELIPPACFWITITQWSCCITT